MRDSFAFPVTSSKQRGASAAAGVRSAKWGVLGRDRSIPHLGRKLYHLAMGLLCFSLYAFVLTREQAIAMLVGVGGVWMLCDLLRLWSPRLNAMALRVFGSLMRREELKGITANTYYILGMLLVTVLFPKPVVLLSVLYLAVGDPVAAIVGTVYGRNMLVAGKSVEGSVANFAVATAITFFFAVAFLVLPADRAILLALVGGTISAIAEAAPLPFNDNFTIPVLSAVLLQVAALVLPIF